MIGDTSQAWINWFALERQHSEHGFMHATQRFFADEAFECFNTEREFAELLDFLEAAQLDRVGCFAYSAVDGAVANVLPDPVPNEIKEERHARFMAVQAKISAARLARRVGEAITVLVDSHEGNVAIARGAADAPEIDGVVRIADGRRLKAGDFARVTVTSASDHDLAASLLS